jgi:hypothetical protein
MLQAALLSIVYCKPLSLLSFTVIVCVVLVGAVAYFLFSEGEEIFFNYLLHNCFLKVFVNRKRLQFCLRGKGGSSFVLVKIGLYTPFLWQNAFRFRFYTYFLKTVENFSTVVMHHLKYSSQRFLSFGFPL